jgi:flagellar hook-associated protein 2
MSTISSGTSSLGSISGIVSGLDTTSIISKLQAYAQKPIDLLTTQQTDATSKLTAWQDLNTRLLALKIKADALASPTSFQAKAATVSSDSALSVSATSEAVAGSTTITVNRLAQAQVEQSQGYSDTGTTTVGTGTVTVGVGAAAKQITINSSNNTLSGLRDAINSAGVGVTASITDLGSLSTHDYHLVLTSNTTGEANAVTWTPTLSGGTAPTWTTTTAASDASITVGSGSTATTLTKSSNTISDVMSGVTLNLKAADVSNPVTVTITADTSGMSTAISDFVDQYNSVVNTISAQFAYSSDTQTSGALMGDYTLQSIQSDLSQVLNVVPGLSSDANSLTQIGFTMASDGTLSVDQDTLSSALASNPDSVMNLFAGRGTSSDQSIQYLSSANATVENGGTSGYAVRIDQVATQSHITSGVAQTDSLAADETLTVNGTAISLTAGMTGQQVLDTINSYSNSTGVTASRTGADGTGSGNYLTLTRNNYGSSGHITAVSTVSNGGASPVTSSSGIGDTQVTEANGAGESGQGTAVAGVDIAGAFGVTVNGVTTWETATGSGQVLMGASGNANTAGLSVLSTATTTGQHGAVTITRGAGASFSKLLSDLTGSTGAVTTAEDAINSQISDLKTTITTQTDSMNAYIDQIQTEFNDMESKLSTLKSTGDYLTAQFTALTNSTSGSSSK